MIVILELHCPEVVEGLSIQILLWLRCSHFSCFNWIPFPHDTKPNEDNVTACSPPILLLFFGFHFSCAMSMQTLPCLKCRSFNCSIYTRPLPTSFKWSQPAFVLGIKLPLPIVNAVSSLTFWTHLWHNIHDQSGINFTLRATFPTSLEGGYTIHLGNSYLDTLNKKHRIVLL